MWLTLWRWHLEDKVIGHPWEKVARREGAEEEGTRARAWGDID